MIVYTIGIAEQQPRLKTVRCPKCGRGRICDIASSAATRLTHRVKKIADAGKNGIYIKCPKCGAFIVFSIYN